MPVRVEVGGLKFETTCLQPTSRDQNCSVSIRSKATKAVSLASLPPFVFNSIFRGRPADSSQLAMRQIVGHTQHVDLVLGERVNITGCVQIKNGQSNWVDAKIE